MVDLEDFRIEPFGIKKAKPMEVVQLHQWQAYKLKEFEYRIAGFWKGKDDNVRCMVTGEVKGVDAPNRRIETKDGKWFELGEPANATNKVHCMYEISKWATNKLRRPPQDATEFMIEQLKAKETFMPTQQIAPEAPVVNEPELMEIPTLTEEPVKRGRGRPKGSKNKTKDES